MPKLIYPLPETQMSITRPVVLSVIRGLAFLTELPQEIPIVFNGADDQAISFNSTLGEQKPFDSTKFNHFQKLKIAVTEKAAEDDLLTQRIHHHDALFCFWDEKLRIEAKPIYSRTEVVVSFVYRSADRRSAEAWRDSIRTKIAQGRAEITHEAEMEYGIPPEYVLVLMELHRLRENQGGYGQSFKEWFMSCVPQKKFTILTKLDGTEPHPVFKEVQMNFVGAFDPFAEPTATNNSESPTWEISLDYRFFYDKPIQMSLVYPQIIHNQLLDEKWRGTNTNTSYSKMMADRSHIQRGYDYFRQLQNHYFGYTAGARIPYFDDWQPLHQQPDYTQLFQVAICIDPDDPEALIDIRSFEDHFTGMRFDWKPEFLAYIKAQGRRILSRLDSIFFATIVEGNDWLDASELEIDEQLNIRRIRPNNIRKIYHLRFYALADLTKLSDRATKDLLQNPKVCLPTLDAMFPGAKPKVINDRLVVRSDYLEIVLKIKGTLSKYNRSNTDLPMTVGAFTIVTHREKT